jgi:hypothetical protein
LICEEVPPLFIHALRRKLQDSDASQTEQQPQKKIDLLIGILCLRALSVLLRTATLVVEEETAESNPHATATAAAFRKMLAQCSCAEFELWRDHWHPEVRAEVAKMAEMLQLREHFELKSASGLPLPSGRKWKLACNLL